MTAPIHPEIDRSNRMKGHAMASKEVTRGLAPGAAIAGSVSVLTAGLITLPIPGLWGLLTWALLAAVFCMGSGWLLGFWLSNIESEEG